MQQLLFEHFGGWFTLQHVDLSSQIQLGTGNQKELRYNKEEERN